MSIKEWTTRLYQSPLVRGSLYNLLFVFVLLPVFAFHAEGCITSLLFNDSAQDQRLENSLIKETEAESVLDCAHLCLSLHPLCKSINFKKGEKQHNKKMKCQLNNETKRTKPEELVNDNDFNYFEPIKIFVIQDNETNQGKPNIVNKSSIIPGYLYRRKLSIEVSCANLYEKGTRADGIYTIDPDGLGAFNVRCDMTISGGGWTVFQRRINGSVDFSLGWQNYTEGFGDLNGEFWLGLNKIHRLSKSGQNVLRVDLETFENEPRYANFSTFAVANKTDKYKLTVGGYSGNARDSLTTSHNGMHFTTKDEDNDMKGGSNCAVMYKGGWWYNNCHDANLNGQYHHNSSNSRNEGIIWYNWKGPNYSLKKTEMKIRPRLF